MNPTVHINAPNNTVPAKVRRGPRCTQTSPARPFALCLLTALGCKNAEQPSNPSRPPAAANVDASEAPPNPTRPAKIVEPRHDIPGVPQHFYFAGLDEQGRVSATLWDEAPEQWDSLSAQMQAQVFEFAADSPLIAGYLRAGPWWGVDGTRVFELVPSGFEIVGGASDSSLAVTLAPPDGAKLSSELAPALVIMGERPTYAQAQWVEMPDYEADPSPAEPTPAGPTHLKASPSISKALRTQIDGALAKARAESESESESESEPGSESESGLSDIGEPQLVYLDGNFSSAARVAAVNLPLTRDGEESYLSGLALCDAKGRPTKWVVELAVRMDEVILDGTLRFAPDGYTHVMYTLRYYEGAYSHIVIWEPDGWRNWSTGGDGA